MTEEIRKKIRDAQLVLVGIGEEFEESRILKNLPQYCRQKDDLQQDKPWAIPALNQYKLLNCENRVRDSYNKLAEMLQDKHYFVVSVTANDLIWDCGLQPERIVAPCGGSRYKQCDCGCQDIIIEINDMEKKQLDSCAQSGNWEKLDLGFCPICGKPLILNNIYAIKYNQQGYQKQWQSYKEWLQGTLNKNLCILELGVGMRWPSVVRWPFEKIGFFNQKADFIRINEKLYQMTEELAKKGIGIAQNAVDWLLDSIE